MAEYGQRWNKITKNYRVQNVLENLHAFEAEEKLIRRLKVLRTVEPPVNCS